MKKAIPVLLLLLLFGGGGYYFFTSAPEAVHKPPAPQLLPPEPIRSEPEPEVETTVAPAEPEPVTPPEPLPLLGESDAEFKASLSAVVGADPLAQYLVKNDIISRLVATIDSLTSRQVPAPINPVRPADGKFLADKDGDQLVMSVQNYARYDGYIALLQHADSDAIVSLYHRYNPLFQQAWMENGGEQSFDERLLEVIDELLATPDVPGPVYLVKPEAVYLFEAEELEAMSAGQKILVRMGSANASVVKEKLTEIRRAVLQ
jgi:hypothetical protein